jgi:hypothetical protein
MAAAEHGDPESVEAQARVGGCSLRRPPLNLGLAVLCSGHDVATLLRLHRTVSAHKAALPPSGPLGVHEIKHDGYRLIVWRDGRRVRAFTCHGHDWTDRFPAIVETARSAEPPRVASPPPPRARAARLARRVLRLEPRA